MRLSSRLNSIARIAFVLLLLGCPARVSAQGAMLPEAFPQFLDINGNPLSSGTLSFFLTGTSTPTTAYSDSALTTPTGTAGVVTLDAGGRPPTAVYLAVQPYKVVLKDSGGVTIATRDPVSGAAYLGLQAATPTIQTTTSTGTVNDFALSSTTAPVVILRCNNATDLTITGFVAGVAGQTVIIQSVGAGNVFLASQNTGSSAANRLINFIATTTTNTPLAAGTGIATEVRDGTTARWRMTTHDQGAAISYTPTWNGTLGNGTVAGTYMVRGRQVYFEIKFVWGSTSSIGGGTGFLFNLPPFVSASTDVVSGPGRILDTSVPTNFGATGFNISATAVTAYAAGTGGTITNAVPMTWATGDTIWLNGWYLTS